MTLGCLIRRYREAKGMSLRKLARDAKVRPALLSELENDKRTDTKFEIVQKVARTLGITPNDLAGKEFRQQDQRGTHYRLLWTSMDL